MKLNNRNGWIMPEYTCELTKELDVLAGLDKREQYDWFHHYIYASEQCKSENCLAIRVPGGTVGAIWTDKNNVITKIGVDTDYVVKTYPGDVNDLIQKYIGEVIEYEESED